MTHGHAHNSSLPPPSPMQSQGSSAGGSKLSVEDQLYHTASDILDKLPPDFDIEEASNK